MALLGDDDGGSKAELGARPAESRAGVASMSAAATASGGVDASPSGTAETTPNVTEKSPTAPETTADGGTRTDEAVTPTPTPSRTQAAGGSGGGGAGAGTGTSTPAPSCTSIGGGKYNCQVWRTAKSYTASGTEAGILNAGTNYFYCQSNLGRRETYGEWTNIWWAKTDDDSGNTNVYVSDVYLKGGDNDAPVPGLPVC